MPRAEALATRRIDGPTQRTAGRLTTIFVRSNALGALESLPACPMVAVAPPIDLSPVLSTPYDALVWAPSFRSSARHALPGSFQ